MNFLIGQEVCDDIHNEANIPISQDENRASLVVGGELKKSALSLVVLTDHINMPSHVI